MAQQLRHHSPGGPESTGSSDSSTQRIKTENENWRGKNDPSERRRIQNRINQRAYRERKRSTINSSSQTPASSPGAYEVRSICVWPADLGSPEPDQQEALVEAGAISSATVPVAVTGTSPTKPAEAGRPEWDELAATINRNLNEAISANARSLGIDSAAIAQGERTTTPVQTRAVAACLAPVPLQYQVPHDLVYDIIPHARLRYNIMAAITRGQLDQTRLSDCIRASGSLELGVGGWQRRGVVVWRSPSTMQNWELTEQFVRSWAFLLDGCEDLMAATNAWRQMRGEPRLTL